MARKRKKSSTKSKRTSRGGGVDWRKSKFLAYGLIAVIVIIWIKMLWPSSSSGIPAELEDFPYTYCTEKTYKVVIVRGQGKTVPFVDEETGENVWEAFQCNFEQCPGRKDGKPLVFPHVLQKMEYPEGEAPPPEMAEEMPPYDYMTPPMCPACTHYKVGGYEYVERYQTDEGRERLQKMQERLAAEAKNN